jgi:hypothetical protein
MAPAPFHRRHHDRLQHWPQGTRRAHAAATRAAVRLVQGCLGERAGDLAALRVCLDRIAPPRKDRRVLFELPPVSSAADAAKVAAALLEAVAVGDLTPAEASELGKLIEAYIKALEATDFAERLTKLERMTNR